MKKVLVYDVSSSPIGLNIQEVVNIMNVHKYLFWDSTKGKKPFLIEDEKGKEFFEFTIVDINSEEGKKLLEKYGSI